MRVSGPRTSRHAFRALPNVRVNHRFNLCALKPYLSNSSLKKNDAFKRRHRGNRTLNRRINFRIRSRFWVRCFETDRVCSIMVFYWVLRRGFSWTTPLLSRANLPRCAAVHVAASARRHPSSTLSSARLILEGTKARSTSSRDRRRRSITPCLARVERRVDRRSEVL